MLRPYNPWWANTLDLGKMKVAELQDEAERRGILGIKGLKKAELLEKLESTIQAFDLSDDNFRKPTFKPSDSKLLD